MCGDTPPTCSTSIESGKSVRIAPLAFDTLADRTPGIELSQVAQTTLATLRVRPAPGSDPERVWGAVRAGISRLLADHGVGHVALERAGEPPGGPRAATTARSGRQLNYGVMIERSSKRNGVVPVVVAALTVLAAYAARLWAERGLDYGDPIPLVGDLFRLTLGENPGVAFGLLDGSPLVPWLAALMLVVFALILARPLLESRSGAVALGMILGGGLANLIDRVGDGRVTDYLDAGVGGWRWPAFNLPDVAITAGFLLVLWTLARNEEDIP